VSTPQPPGNPEPPAPSAPPAAAPPTAPVANGEQEHDDFPSTWQPWLYVKIALLLLAIAWATAFIAENGKRVNVHFVFATANVHLIWMILLLLAVGILAGVLVSQLYRHRRRSRLAKKTRKPSDSRAAVGR
jgi:uncharacterized integral membrane protein